MAAETNTQTNPPPVTEAEKTPGASASALETGKDAGASRGEAAASLTESAPQHLLGADRDRSLERLKKQVDPALAEIPLQDPLFTTVTRNNFYRDGFRNLLKFAIFQAVIIVMMTLAIILILHSRVPEDRYFATTADGRIMQLVSLDQPNLTDAALLSWVSQAATEVMTFGFHDYRRRLQSSSKYFTRRGWESFVNALTRSRIIEAVEANQQVLTAAPTSAPVITQKGLYNGRFRWVIELPLLVTTQSGTKTQTTNMAVSITVERVPTLESPTGVGIEGWIAR